MLAVVLLVLAGTASAAHAEVVWLCKPGLADDPCVQPMQTTVREPDGTERVEDDPVPAQRPVDCFYVYPTVSNQPTPNADQSRDPELVSIAKYQAARFSRHCRVFAPIYRQGTLLALSSAQAQDQEAIRRTAYADVLEAWRAYLREDNGGRGVVLLGHSQGTRMLRQLLRTEIERDPAQHRLLVSAVLLGGNVTVARGQVRGGDFARTPLCTVRGQVGCVVAFSTFAQDPPDEPRYGKPDEDGYPPFGFPAGEGFEVACTDPSALADTKAPLRLLLPSEPFAPGPIAAGTVVTAGGPPPTADTPWVVPPDRFAGGCRKVNGANVLRYDPLPGSRRPNPFPDPTWGTHLVDVNLGLDRLVPVVGTQSARYVAGAAGGGRSGDGRQAPGAAGSRSLGIRLVRRCIGRGRLRVALGGDLTRVRGVRFALGRRVVKRDRTQPFERVLTRRVLQRRGQVRTLRALVGVRGGKRIVLRRSLPGCGVRTR